jgi:hypothetical protein
MSGSAQWISVGDLAEAFGPGNFAPVPTAELAGTTRTLHVEDGRVVRYQFLSDSRLAWEVLEGEGRGRGAEEGYFALRVRDDIYFVDYVEHEEIAGAVSLVLDLAQMVGTVLKAVLPDSPDVGESLWARAAAGKELTAVCATFSSAAVDGPFTETTVRHLPTHDLVGRRVEYTYSPSERYEHIYLNENLYTWHCLLGAEKGLADTDRCHVLKLGDDLYLFVWREKIVPTLGAVVIDLRAMRTMGKIVGHGAAGRSPAGRGPGGHAGRTSGGLVNFPVGARARLLNITEHGEGMRP